MKKSEEQKKKDEERIKQIYKKAKFKISDEEYQKAMDWSEGKAAKDARIEALKRMSRKK